MKSVNLYVLASMKNMRLYGKYYASLSGEKERTYKPHEAQSLCDFVKRCMQEGAIIRDFDGYYYGYIIPRIGKEFDILKIGKDAVLNIELKSWVGDKELVLAQLVKNKFYLAHLNKKRYYFTFNSDTQILYKLSPDGQLITADFVELIALMKGTEEDESAPIDELFEVSQFILSPTENPERFINGEYFLTQQQQQIKKSALSSLEDNKFVKISGSPGTGKTLLLYELAISLAKDKKVCFMQPGKVSAPQKMIEQAFSGITFCEAEGDIERIGQFDFLLCDESERYSNEFFNKLLYGLKRVETRCIFAFEKLDIFAVGERTTSSSRMAKIRGTAFSLSGKIRINNGISHFIQCLFDKGKPIHSVDFSDVEIICSNSRKQTDELIYYLKKDGFINLSDEKELVSKIEKARGDVPINDSYGKEYDHVSLVVDGDYFYTSKGKLYSRKTNAFAENLYSAITRVRKKLCLIVENNEQLLERALFIKCNEKSRKK